MYRLRQIGSVASYNFRQWRKNPRIFITFALAFILCFLLSDKAVRFSKEYGTIMQIVESFVWTFGDSNSILLSSLLLVLLFADMPFIGNGTPLYLVRVNRKVWLAGQALYISLATSIYMVFILFSTAVVTIRNSFVGNMWSETAAILGYSGAGEAIALPALVKTLEMSTPYECMATIFLLMLLYTLLMTFIMLIFNIYKGQMAGVISVFVFSLYGFLLNPQLIKTLMQLPALEAIEAEGDEKTGVNIIKRALEAPLRQIADNAGLEGSVVVENVKKNTDPHYGFDAAKAEYGDMVKKGILDPTKVTRSALQNAASIASMVLTTESLVADIPEPEPPMPAGGAGGMGGGMY
jgi:hypothetical protein